MLIKITKKELERKCEIYNKKEVARQLGISRLTLRTLLKRNDITVHRTTSNSCKKVLVLDESSKK
jgi:DNA-binding CsgD family transcriptional regulator